METSMLDDGGFFLWSGIQVADGPLRYEFPNGVASLLEAARTHAGIAATGKGLLAVWALAEKEDTGGLVRCMHDERLSGLVRREAKKLLSVCWERDFSRLELTSEEMRSKFDWALKKARTARILALGQQTQDKIQQHPLRKA